MSRWIYDISASTPVDKLAARAMLSRFQKVCRFLKLAARHPERDPEYVHQLRVATRRSEAVLRVFRPWVAKSRRKDVAARLKRLRRAAGAARDLDVLRLRLESTQDHPREELEVVLPVVVLQREQVQGPLVGLFRQMRKEHLKKRLRRLTESLRWRARGPEPAYGMWGSRLLRGLLEEFQEQATTDLQLPENLHQLRIAGKRLRYAIELLSGTASRDQVEPAYRAVSAIQDELGAINDHSVAARHLEHWAESGSFLAEEDALRSMAARERDLGQQKRRQFLADWNSARAATIVSAVESLLERRPA